jgi:hypothetical protein
MRFTARCSGSMSVTMMLVVPVQMIVLERLVHMLVLVALGDMQPHAEGHQGAREPEPDR